MSASTAAKLVANATTAAGWRDDDAHDRISYVLDRLAEGKGRVLPPLRDADLPRCGKRTFEGSESVRQILEWEVEDDAGDVWMVCGEGGSGSAASVGLKAALAKAVFPVRIKAWVYGDAPNPVLWWEALFPDRRDRMGMRIRPAMLPQLDPFVLELVYRLPPKGASQALHAMCKQAGVQWLSRRDRGDDYRARVAIGGRMAASERTKRRNPWEASLRAARAAVAA